MEEICNFRQMFQYVKEPKVTKELKEISVCFSLVNLSLRLEILQWVKKRLFSSLHYLILFAQELQ